jgi:predicted nucleic acid-binding Zn ribbon protein
MRNKRYFSPVNEPRKPPGPARPWPTVRPAPPPAPDGGPQSPPEPPAPVGRPVPPAVANRAGLRGSAAPVDMSGLTPPMGRPRPAPARPGHLTAWQDPPRASVTDSRASVTDQSSKAETRRKIRSAPQSRGNAARVTDTSRQRAEQSPVTVPGTRPNAVRRIRSGAGRPVGIQPIVKSSVVMPEGMESKFLQYIEPKRKCASCDKEFTNDADPRTITCSNACRQRMYRDNKRTKETAKQLATAKRMKGRM